MIHGRNSCFVLILNLTQELCFFFQSSQDDFQSPKPARRKSKRKKTDATQPSVADMFSKRATNKEDDDQDEEGEDNDEEGADIVRNKEQRVGT